MKTKNELEHLRALMVDWLDCQAVYMASDASEDRHAHNDYLVAKRRYCEACMNYVAWILTDDDQNTAGQL